MRFYFHTFSILSWIKGEISICFEKAVCELISQTHGRKRKLVQAYCTNVDGKPARHLQSQVLEGVN